MEKLITALIVAGAIGFLIDRIIRLFKRGDCCHSGCVCHKKDSRKDLKKHVEENV